MSIVLQKKTQKTCLPAAEASTVSGHILIQSEVCDFFYSLIELISWFAFPALCQAPTSIWVKTKIASRDQVSAANPAAKAPHPATKDCHQAVPLHKKGWSSCL